MDKPLWEKLGDTRVIVRVILPATAVTLEELEGLEPNTLLRLPVKTSSRAQLMVNGRALAEGEVVVTSRQLAFSLRKIL